MIHLFGHEITLFQIIATLFGISILVFIHELGHFLMAKKFGIPVIQFAFGFGPELIGFTYKETRYSLCAIPLGGLVKMPGENPNDAQGGKDEFMSQPWYRRVIIAFFGPFMNYFLAFLLFFSVIYFWGIPTPSNEPVIGEVMEKSPAVEAGLRKGDRVLSIDGKSMNTWEEMAEYVHGKAGAALDLTVRRGEGESSLTVTPRKDPSTGIGLIGIIPETVTEKVGALRAAGIGLRIPVIQTVQTFRILGSNIIRREKPELAGPVGVVQIIAQAAKTGIPELLYLLGAISVALGMFNLLPIPIVDGGHIMFALIEGITRKPLSRKLMTTANLIGLAIIVAIFLFATYSDVARIGAGWNQAAPK